MSWRRHSELGFERGNVRRRSRPVRGRGLGISYVVFVGCAIGLLVGGFYYPSYFADVRARLDGLAGPVLVRGVELSAPVRALGRKLGQTLNASSQLERLTRENQELRGWKWRAGELERKLEDLRALAKVVREPGVGFVTAQVLSVSPGPLRHSILVDAGRRHGLNVGDGAINGDGLVGIVAQMGEDTARVRLLDDPDTRVDVVVGRDRVLALLKGDRAGLARLEILGEGVSLRVGDQVSTSGSVAGVPRGLKVGMVVLENGRLRVAPYAALARLEYVSLLLRPSTSSERLVDGQRLFNGDGVARGGAEFSDTTRMSDKRVVGPTSIRVWPIPGRK